MAISGLLREDTIEVTSKIPWLGDIPLLGYLFRSTTKRKQKTNLLVFVTPHIVEDAREAQALRERLEEETSLSFRGHRALLETDAADAK